MVKKSEAKTEKTTNTKVNTGKWVSKKWSKNLPSNVKLTMIPII
jgi:hypothetical protein